VLLSETTRALVGSAVPAGVAVHPVGERRLKDLDEPERVYELEIEGVATSEPAAPAPVATAESTFEQRTEDLAQRMSERIEADVLRSLERALGDRDRDA
jgi:hypothetical protein